MRLENLEICRTKHFGISEIKFVQSLVTTFFIFAILF